LATVGNLPKLFRRIKVRQIRGNVPEFAILIGVDDPVFTPAMAAIDKLKRLPTQRVKRMHDPEFAADRSNTARI
jgi:hypothetical protein